MQVFFYRFLLVFFLAGFSGLGSGGAERILRSASSNECGASVKGLPALPAGLGLCRVFFISALCSSIVLLANLPRLPHCQFYLSLRRQQIVLLLLE